MGGFKLTIDSTEVENDKALRIINRRPECGISALEFEINNYQSRNYSDLIDVFDKVKLELKHKNYGYTTTFYGEVYALQPQLNPETLTVYCKGLEHCMAFMHCDESYGSESMEPHATEDTPRHLFQQYIEEHVENMFGEADATGWTLNESDTYIEDVHSGLLITNLASNYNTVYEMYKKLGDIVSAYAITLDTPEPGIHWYVDPNTTSPRIYLKEIGDDHSSGNWPKYYGGTQSTATITQGIDIEDYILHQSIEHYCTDVILASALRIPQIDFWTDSKGGITYWSYIDCALSNDSAAGNFVVGDSSLKSLADEELGIFQYRASNLGADAAAAQKNVTVENVEPFKVGDSVTLWEYLTADMEIATIASIAGSVLTMEDNLTNAYTTANESVCIVNLGWDITKAGSEYTVPTINFYYKKNADFNDGVGKIHLMTYDGTEEGFTCTFDTWSDPDNEWIHHSIPIGPYWKQANETQRYRWTDSGSADWSQIDSIQFYVAGVADSAAIWIDDLHIAGRIVRHAYSASERGTYDDRQVFLRLDTAIEDTLNTSNNTGTAARLAAAELFKRSQFKTSAANRFLTGTITMPMKEDLLPGQQLYVNAGKKLGSNYAYQLDMRCLEVVHEVDVRGYKTKVQVTSDLWNSLTFDTPSAWGILQESAGALNHSEARDLKASGVDIGIARLAFDPTV